MTDPLTDRPGSLLTDLVQRRPAVVPVIGASMLPLLKTGDHVLVDPRIHARVGDVVLCLIDERFVMHRLVAVSGTMFQTRGDNVPGGDAGLDPEVTRVRVLGVATRRIRAGRTFGLRWPRSLATSWGRVAPLVQRTRSGVAMTLGRFSSNPSNHAR